MFGQIPFYNLAGKYCLMHFVIFTGYVIFSRLDSLISHVNFVFSCSSDCYRNLITMFVFIQDQGILKALYFNHLLSTHIPSTDLPSYQSASV